MELDLGITLRRLAVVLGLLVHLGGHTQAVGVGVALAGPGPLVLLRKDRPGGLVLAGPELQLGRALARGSNLQTAIGELGAYVESFEVARHLLEHARRNGLETPISSTFAALSEGRMSPNDAIQALMERRVGTE